MTDDAITELTPVLGSVRAACSAAGRPQANHYRRHRQSPKPDRPVREPRAQPRALSPAERDTVRAVLNSPTFADMASASAESKVLAEKLLADTIAKHDINRDQLTIHADNGSSMASKPVAFLLADLGVTKSHSRPHTSNDKALAS